MPLIRSSVMDKPDLSLFPAEPGVYLYKDGAGRILYVGKARRLRQRIASYFRDGSGLSAKTRTMLRAAERIDILRTGTEKEALLLEASLIKKHRPRYNIVLRDDKEYLLFRIAESHPYPRIEVVRRNQHKGRDRQARFFGPFSSGQAARETWKLIHKYLPLRRCRDAAFANRTRPCLYYDMGQCLAPCVLPVPEEEYRVLLDKAVLLLSGRSRHLVKRLNEEMALAASELRFEQAARLRDQIRALERTLERQSVVLPHGRSLDILGVAQVPEGLALGIVFVRDGLLLDGRTFFWPGLTVEDTPELISGFLAQFYLDRRGLGDSIPPHIVAPWLPDLAGNEPHGSLPEEAGDDGGPAGGLAASSGSGAVFNGLAHPGGAGANLNDNGAKPRGPDAVCNGPGSDSDGSAHLGGPGAGSAVPDGNARRAGAGDEVADGAEEDGSADTHGAPVEQGRMRALESALAEIRGGPVRITRPRGRDEDKLSLMAASNAREAVKSATSVSMADLLARALGAAKPVRRIEAVDISHTGGRQTRAGLIVFEDEQPLAGEFRTYSLDADLARDRVEAGDDYAALAAWAARRAVAGEPWPDLLLVDGGKGQLAAVQRAFAGAGVADRVFLASIAKARTEDGRADRRAGNVGDRVFLPGRSNPLNLQAGGRELLFLQRVRDAVHDYVIGRHRRARAAATLTGELTRLPGVGPEMARRLFAHFGSLAAMAEAGEDALLKVPGVGRARAGSIAARLAALVGNGPDRGTDA